MAVEFDIAADDDFCSIDQLLNSNDPLFYDALGDDCKFDPAIEQPWSSNFDTDLFATNPIKREVQTPQLVIKQEIVSTPPSQNEGYNMSPGSSSSYSGSNSSSPSLSETYGYNNSTRGVVNSLLLPHQQIKPVPNVSSTPFYSNQLKTVLTPLAPGAAPMTSTNFAVLRRDGTISSIHPTSGSFSSNSTNSGPNTSHHLPKTLKFEIKPFNNLNNLITASSHNRGSLPSQSGGANFGHNNTSSTAFLTAPTKVRSASGDDDDVPMVTSFGGDYDDYLGGGGVGGRSSSINGGGSTGSGGGGTRSNSPTSSSPAQSDSDSYDYDLGLASSFPGGNDMYTTSATSSPDHGRGTSHCLINGSGPHLRPAPATSTNTSRRAIGGDSGRGTNMFSSTAAALGFTTPGPAAAAVSFQGHSPGGGGGGRLAIPSGSAISFTTSNAAAAAAANKLKDQSPTKIAAMLDYLSKPMPRKGVVMLTDEEKRTFLSEGLSLPTKLPLTKQEERDLKRVRRRIKNKIAAHESRRKRREYVDKLERQIDLFAQENDGLKRRLQSLENSNRSLLSQLAKVPRAIKQTFNISRTVVGSGRGGGGSKQHQETSSLNDSRTSTGGPGASTCLMVFVLFFSVFFGGGTSSGDATAYGWSSRATSNLGYDIRPFVAPSVTSIVSGEASGLVWAGPLFQHLQPTVGRHSSHSNRHNNAKLDADENVRPAEDVVAAIHHSDLFYFGPKVRDVRDKVDPFTLPFVRSRILVSTMCSAAAGGGNEEYITGDASGGSYSAVAGPQQPSDPTLDVGQLDHHHDEMLASAGSDSDLDDDLDVVDTTAELYGPGKPIVPVDIDSNHEVLPLNFTSYPLLSIVEAKVNSSSQFSAFSYCRRHYKGTNGCSGTTSSNSSPSIIL